MDRFTQMFQSSWNHINVIHIVGVYVILYKYSAKTGLAHQFQIRAFQYNFTVLLKWASSRCIF
jgi:hypothetical protein